MKKKKKVKRNIGKTNWASLLAAVEHIDLRVKWVQLKTFHILGTQFYTFVL